MKMKDYQDRAVAELVSRSKELLRVGGKVLVFKSPTGSGKTIMMAEFLTLLTTETNRSLSFIWAAPRSLHKQSHDKLARYYEDSMALDCAYFSDLTDNQIGENQILFFNWESVVRESAVIVRENETDFYLEKVLENTRADGREIVLIVDESQFAAETDLARNIIATIAPALAVEVSATPTVENEDDRLTVFLDEVQEEGMIKKSVVINEGFKNMLAGDGIRSTLAESTDEFVLGEALKKREQLAAAFAAEPSGVKPLLCVQLPDRNTQQDDNVRNTVVQTLAEKDITVENGKLAIWLSEEKENLKGISDNGNSAEVLLFKQAIALGWDCPRAHILVLFRQWRSIVFSVQTLGRIMRMPQPEVGHYENEILNAGYVYTNLPEMGIHRDISDNYARIHAAYRIDGYDSLALLSEHRLRQREQTRLSPLFIALFLEEAKKYGLAEKIKRENQQVEAQFIADYKAAGVDAMTGEKIPGNIFVDVANEEDLQKFFDYFARDILTSAGSSYFYPEDRSIGRVKDAIYEFFGGPLEMGDNNYSPEVVKITLSEDNRKYFVDVFGKTKDAYREETDERKEPLKSTPKWEIKPTATYGKNYEEREAAKSVMQPFFAAPTESEPEKKFIELLEKSKKVKWWYKNGESEKRYFAVRYLKKGKERLFYVDFIVRFADGSVGLYDTKSGRTIDDAKEKSDALLAYVKKHSQKGQKLVGGIVAPIKIGDSDEWKICLGGDEDWDGDNLSNWEPLEF